MTGLTQSNPFELAPASDVPLGVQLTWRLRAMIVTGRLTTGEPLPSLRRVAEWAGVNVNTVRAAYETLEQDGLIHSQQGRGTFVAEGVAAEPDLESIALEALQRGQSAGRDPREVATVVMACAEMLAAEERLPASPGEAVDESGAEDSETIEVRQELRRQIARLETELTAYVRDLPELYTATPRAQARVTGVDELERTRDTLIAKLSEAQKAAEQRARREGEARRGRPEAAGEGPLASAKKWWSAPPD
ncbi:MAG TPA: GntR family transcriptional regulator [Solirubrobacterales bacterium]|nr:GntR family transcriptional regulator [Solirubrobacterales bacterium]